ncbi:hypothetical protein [Burkholderia sp. BCC1998]|uniref:hypothetical protein n=1 Tax=Burkholderia sp. BCC1998 TaxID=2817447 RepID=UPI002AB76CA5|nr:hypothetical protein [Burkholderia sp. BCC1998]
MSDVTNAPMQPGTPPPDEFLRRLSSAGVPHLYCNGFGIAYSPSDATIFLNLNDSVVGRVSLSHETLRSLAIKLREGIDQFEKAVGMSLPSSDELSERLQVSGTATNPSSK